MKTHHLAVAALVAAALSAALLFGKLHSQSGDIAHTYALIRTLMDHGGRPQVFPNLGEMNFYPPLTHWLAVLAGYPFDSGLIGMTIVASASVGLFYFSLFGIALQIRPLVPIVACAATIVLGLLGWPVFGKELVGNYFFSQVVASGLAAFALLLTLSKFRQWNGFVLDGIVLIAAQIIIVAHLLPASHLIGAYCIILLVQAFEQPSRRAFGRVALFALASVVLTLLNRSARVMAEISRNDGSIGLGVFGHRGVQISVIVLAAAAALQLIRMTFRKNDAGLFLGSMGLAASVLALFQTAILWLGLGSPYAASKHIFAVCTLFIFTLSALAVLAQSRFVIARASTVAALAACILGAVLTTRVLLRPVQLDPREIASLQQSVRRLAAGIDMSGNDRPIMLMSRYAPSMSYMVSIGDLLLPRDARAEAVHRRRSLPSEGVSLVFMPSDDRLIIEACRVASLSDARVSAMDFKCYAANGGDWR